MIEETATLHVSIKSLIIIGCSRRFQSDIIRGKNPFYSLCNLKRRNNEGQGVYVPWLSQGWLFSNSYKTVSFKKRQYLSWHFKVFFVLRKEYQRNTLGLWIFVGCQRMSENSWVGLHRVHCIILYLNTSNKVTYLLWHCFWHLLHWVWYCFDNYFTYFVPELL